MDVSGKRIAVLGGTLISCELVKAAKALGMHTTVIDYNPPEQSPAKLIADAHAQISVADIDAVVEYLKENEIDGVIAGYADVIMGWYADICEKADAVVDFSSAAALESVLSFCEMLGLTPTEDMKNAKNPEEFFQVVYEAKKLVDEQENQNPSKKKKLSKREIEKEIQAEKTWKSIRGIYLELVKELHPDKEADETQRLLKEERMKQLTKAYQEKDLASLLRMQINWLEESAKEPIDQTDDVLKQYNKVLQAQVDRLEQEYDLLCNAPFPGILGAYAGFRKYSLKELPGVLEQMNNLHRKEIANLETYVALSRNVKGVKLCLKDFIYMQEHKGLDTIFDNLWDL